MADNKAFKVNDKVRRADKTGPIGIVKQVRTEATASAENKEKGRMYHVLFDNGTLSSFGGEGLELVEAG